MKDIPQFDYRQKNGQNLLDIQVESARKKKEIGGNMNIN